MHLTLSSAQSNEMSTMILGKPILHWFGSPGGIATLDTNGKLEPQQMPEVNVASSISGTINPTSLASVESAQLTISNDNESKLFIIADETGTYPTRKDAVVAPTEVITALSYSSPSEGVRKLLTNWEAYYKVAGKYYSQNIKKYLLADIHPQPMRTGDLILLTKRKVSAVDFIALYIDFDSIDVLNQLSGPDKLAWVTYKATIGCGGKTDGDTIKAMLEKDLIFGCTDDENYSCISDGGFITMYDYKVFTQNRPLKTFSGSFNSGNDCDLPGIYNSITLGRPPASYSGETYTIVVKPDGSHWAYSNTHPAHNFYRPSKFDEWVSLGTA